MADDQLIYGINFNLDEGVEAVKKQWAEKNKELGELFSANFSINIDENSVKNFESIIRNLQNIDPIKSETYESIAQLVSDLVELEKMIKSVDDLNSKLSKTSTITAKEISDSTIKIAKAEQALAKAREASEKANLAAQRTETERARTIITEEKALKSIAREYEEAAKAQEKLNNAQKSAEVPKDWIERYAQGYEELIFGLDRVIEKYNELAQVSPSSTVGSGIPELVSQIESLSKTYTDFEGDITLQKTIEEVEIAYSKLALQLGELNKEYENASESSSDYSNSQERVYESTKDISSNLSNVGKSINSSAKDIASVSYVAADSFNQLSESAQEDAKALIGFQNALVETKKELSELNNAFAEGNVGEAEYTTRKAQLLSLQKDQTASVTEYQKILEYNVQLLNNEAGSYKAVEAELKLTQIELRKLSAERNASIKDIAQLQQKSRSLTEELERQRVASGKYALTAGSYGQSIRDLTYAVRLLDPSLGILVQRTQRISVLNNLWNKTNDAIVKSLKVTSQVASKIMIGAIGGLSIAIAGVVQWYQKWKEEQDKIAEISSSFSSTIRKDVAGLDIYINALSKATEGTTTWYNLRSKLISDYGEYLKALGLEGKSVQELKDNYLELAAAIAESSRTDKYIKAQQEIRDELEQNIGKNLVKIYEIFEEFYGEEEGKNRADKFWNAFLEKNGEYSEELLSQLREIEPQVIRVLGSAAGYQAGELETYIDSLKKPIKNYTKSLKELNKINDIFSKDIPKTVDLIKDTQDAIKDLELWPRATPEQVAAYNAEKQRLQALLKSYNELGIVTKSQKKDAISLLKEELSLIGSAYDKYQGLIDTVGEFNAESIIRETYKALIPDDKFVFSIDELRKSYDTAIAKLRKLKVSEADILKLKVQIDDRIFKETQKKLKDKFDDLEKEINKRKIANTFFDKIVGTTGDVKLATRLTLDITGRQIEDLRTSLYNDIQKGFKNFGVDVEITPDLKVPDIQKEIDKLPKDQQASLQKLLDNLIQYDTETINSLLSNLAKYEDYESKRTAIVQKGEEERRQIREQSVLGEDADKLIEASIKKQKELLASLEFSELKEGGLWQSTFEDLEKVGTRTLDILIERIQRFLDVAGQELPIKEYKELVKTLEKLKDEKADRSIFGTIVSSVKNLSKARQELNDVEARNSQIIAELNERERELQRAISDVNTSDSERLRLTQELIKAQRERAKATDEVGQAENKVKSAGQQAASGIGKLSGKFKEIAATAQRTNDLMFELADSLGLVSDEARQSWEDISTVIAGQMEIAQGAGDFIGGMFSGDIGSMVNGIGESVNGTLQSIIGFVNFFKNKKLAKINKQIEEQANIVSDLAYAYTRLQKETSKAFGSDIAKGYKEQTKNLQAQLEATQKQLELEQGKGKKADKDQIKQYQESIRDYYDEIADLQIEFIESLLGTDVSSAAKSFADSWLDAYLSFGDTKKAIQDSYKDLIKSLVVNTVLGQAIEGLLQEVFDDAGALYDENNQLNQKALSKLVEGTEKFANDFDAIATQLAEALDLRGNLGDTLESSLTGLAASVTGLTEETALSLAGNLGTIEYYTTGQYYVTLDILEEIRNRDNIGDSDGVNMAALISIQNSMLSQVMSIQNDTGSMVHQLRTLVDMFNSVRTVRGAKSSYGLTISNL